MESHNSTNEKEESSDLAIGSDSHEDYTAQVQDNADNRYQINGKTMFDNPHVNERLKLVPIDKILHIPSNHRVLSPLPIPLPIITKEPFQLNIPVPVKIEKELVVPVEKTVYHPVVRPVPIMVVKEVQVPISQPYPLFKPVYKLKLIIHSEDEALSSIDDHDY